MNLRTSATGFGTAPVLAVLGVMLLSDCRGVVPPLSTADQIVEIRVYTLKAGTRDRFHELFLRDALPMLQRWRVDVVAHGPSLHDNDSYFLMRSYASLEDRTRSQDAFYGSAEWTQGQRDALLSSIDRYSTAVIRLDEATREGLRRTGSISRAPDGTQGGDMTHADRGATSTGSDVAALVALNDDYIRAVQTSDVDRFREILADDFLCSLPDGSAVRPRSPPLHCWPSAPWEAPALRSRRA